MTTQTPMLEGGDAASAVKHRWVHRLLDSTPLWIFAGFLLSHPIAWILGAAGLANPRVVASVASGCIAVALYGRRWLDNIPVRAPIVALIPYTLTGLALAAAQLALLIPDAAAVSAFSATAAGCAIGVTLYVPLLIRRRRAVRRLH